MEYKLLATPKTKKKKKMKIPREYNIIETRQVRNKFNNKNFWNREKKTNINYQIKQKNTFVVYYIYTYAIQINKKNSKGEKIIRGQI